MYKTRILDTTVNVCTREEWINIAGDTCYTVYKGKGSAGVDLLTGKIYVNDSFVDLSVRKQEAYIAHELGHKIYGASECCADKHASQLGYRQEMIDNLLECKRLAEQAEIEPIRKEVLLTLVHTRLLDLETV